QARAARRPAPARAAAALGAGPLRHESRRSGPCVSLHAPPPMRIEDLDYELPPELIAQHPAARREDSRLLVLERATGELHDLRFTDLPGWLEPGDALVLNETRVRPARLIARRPTGGAVELLFVRPEADPAAPAARWRVLAPP